MGLPGGFEGSLTLSGRIALWEGFLAHWAGWMRQQVPEIALRLEIGFEEGIMQGLVQGSIDIGVMYTPERRPGLGIEWLFDESQVLVGTDPACPWPDLSYIHVDWEPEFYALFSGAFPNMAPPARMVRDLQNQGWVHRIADVPAFTLPVYMVYPLDRSEPVLNRALDGLRQLAAGA